MLTKGKAYIQLGHSAALLLAILGTTSSSAFEINLCSDSPCFRKLLSFAYSIGRLYAFDDFGVIVNIYWDRIRPPNTVWMHSTHNVMRYSG